MNSLDDAYQDLMYLKRKRYLLDFEGLATILNARKEHMLDAQLGKTIPSDTFKALIGWLDSK